MTAHATSGALPDLPMQVRYKSLLYILSAAPIGGLIVLIDRLFLNGAIQKAMDIPISQVLFITAILTFPHIVASAYRFCGPRVPELL